MDEQEKAFKESSSNSNSSNSSSSNNNVEKSTLGDMDVLVKLKAKMEKGENK